MGYAPLPAEYADAAWQGASAYTPLTAEAADSSWWAASPSGATPYVPLPSLYADASWQGAAPYTRLAASSADASWVPVLAAGAQVAKAQGFRVSNFGAAYKAVPPAVQVGVASGEASTLFGLAKIAHAALGFVSTTLGAVRSQLVFSGGAWPPTPAVGAAIGIESGRFGTPTAAGALTVQAAGAAFVHFSAPTAGQRFGATGAALALLGTPALRLSAHARGFSAAYTGTARARLTLHAAGFPSARWGLARASALVVGVAQGMNSTQLGEPTHSTARRALHLPPGTRFGKPLLLRSTTC